MIHLQTKGFTADERLIEYVTDKVQSLSSAYKRIMDANIILKSSRSRTQSGKVCELKLSIEGNDLIAVVASTTFDDAVTRAVKAARSQLRKLKESRRHRVNRSRRPTA